MLIKKKDAEQPTATKTLAKATTTKASASAGISPSRKKGTKTRVLIKFDVGFGNALYLRGRGANLSWDKGVMLHNTNDDEWIWETDASFANCEFKALINDTEYESGENHLIKSGEIVQYTPEFYH